MRRHVAFFFALNLVQGFPRTRPNQISHCESDMCSGIIGADLECPSRGCGGFIRPSGVVQDDRQIVVVVGAQRVDSNGPPEQFHRFFETPQRLIQGRAILYNLNPA